MIEHSQLPADLDALLAKVDHPGAYEAWVLSERIRTLQQGPDDEAARDIFLEIAVLASEAFPNMPSSGHAEQTDNPAATPLLAFFLQSLARYRGAVEHLVKPETKDIREALANAFCLTGKQGRRTRMNLETKKAVCSAFSSARALADRAGKSPRDCFEAGLQAAYLARYGHDEQDSKDRATNRQALRKFLEAEGYGSISKGNKIN